jgi:hypothetical protein
MRNLSAQTKLALLSVVAALAVTYVRHELQSHWHWAPSIEEFLVSWLVHWFALAFLTGVAAAIAIWCNRFFLGYEWEDTSKGILEFYYHVLVVALVASVLIAFIANYVPTDDF